MNKQFTTKLLLALVTAVLLFHICIITKIIPYNIAWGGRLQNDTQMYRFESVSLATNLFLILVLLMKGRLIKFRFSETMVDFILSVYAVLFLTNTVGNLFAKTNFEKLFAIVTLAFAIMIGKIMMKNKNEKQQA